MLRSLDKFSLGSCVICSNCCTAMYIVIRVIPSITICFKTFKKLISGIKTVDSQRQYDDDAYPGIGPWFRVNKVMPKSRVSLSSLANPVFDSGSVVVLLQEGLIQTRVGGNRLKAPASLSDSIEVQEQGLRTYSSRKPISQKILRKTTNTIKLFAKLITDVLLPDDFS